MVDEQKWSLLTLLAHLQRRFSETVVVNIPHHSAVRALLLLCS